MSYTDVGKDAKHNGVVRPKHAPIPPDASTPKAVRKSKDAKPFGLRYELKIWRGKWQQTRRWFRTEAHRDQAFAKEQWSQASWMPSGFLQYRGLEKMERR